ncbi:hypothetical protein ACTXT7_004574 [Hymenolepis weldensis]
MKEVPVESVQPPLLTNTSMSQEGAEGEKMNSILQQQKKKKLIVPLRSRKNWVCRLIPEYVKEEAEMSKMQSPTAEDVYSIYSGLRKHELHAEASHLTIEEPTEKSLLTPIGDTNIPRGTDDEEAEMNRILQWKKTPMSQ